MRSIRVLRSGAFRFALLCASVFAVASIVLLFVVERSISTYAVEATKGSLEREASVLRSDDHADGRKQLLRAIGRRLSNADDQPFRYRLVTAGGAAIAGDLPSLQSTPGWGSVVVDEPGRRAGDRVHREVFQTMGVRLDDGALLVVGTDTFDVQQLRRRLDVFTIAAGFGVTILALVGGYFVGGVFLRRLDRVNAAAGRIMAGDLSERLPAIGMSREFDQLSANLNLMIDRIGALMDNLRQVSTDIAHDLRTPLTRLRQQLEGLRGTGPTIGATGISATGTGDAGIDDAIAQTDEILRIFRALLRIGTIEGGHGRKRFDRVDLSEVMQRVALAYQPVAEDSGKRLYARIVDGIAVIGDGELLAQMFTNLVENAVHHTASGTRITMALELVAGRPVASVADDGPGIPVHERGNVLKRFYRLDRSRATPGAGLGLAMVAAIVQLHDAELAIDDAGQEHGLMVSVRFRQARAD